MGLQAQAELAGRGRPAPLALWQPYNQSLAAGELICQWNGHIMWRDLTPVNPVLLLVAAPRLCVDEVQQEGAEPVEDGQHLGPAPALQPALERLQRRGAKRGSRRQQMSGSALHAVSARDG